METKRERRHARKDKASSLDIEGRLETHQLKASACAGGRNCTKVRKEFLRFEKDASIRFGMSKRPS